MSLKVGTDDLTNVKIGSTDAVELFKGNDLVYSKFGLTPIDLITNGTDYANWTLNGVTSSNNQLLFVGDGDYNTAIYPLTNEVTLGQMVTLAVDVVSTTLDSTEDFGLSSLSISGVTTYIDCTSIGRKYYSFEVQDITTYNRIRILTTLSMAVGEDLVLENIALFNQIVDANNDPREPFDYPIVPIDVLDSGANYANWSIGVGASISNGLIVFPGDGTNKTAILNLASGDVAVGQEVTLSYDVKSTSLNNVSEFGISSLSLTGSTIYIDSRTTGRKYLTFNVASPNTYNRIRLIQTTGATAGENVSIANIALFDIAIDATNDPREPFVPLETTAPATPTNVDATATYNSITVTWDASANATSYDVEFEGVVTTTTGLTQTFNGLTSSTGYDYRVRATNGAGSSAYSTLATETTTSTPSGTSVVDYGAVANANYYDSVSKKYYTTSAFTTLATDNTTAFTNAFNSGNNILVPSGNFLVDGNVDFNKAVIITGATGSKIRSNPQSSALTRLFTIRGDGTVIDGLTVESQNAYHPWIAGVAEAGYGSNKFAFQPEGNNIIIQNCTTQNICRGVDRLDQTIRRNLTISNCQFLDGTIPIFLQYIDGVTINNTDMTMNGTGLATGFHSLYMAKDTSNVKVTGGNIECLYPHAGTLIQLVKTGYAGVTLRTIEFDTVNIDTYQPIIFSTGALDGLHVHDCTVVKQTQSSTRRTKICQEKEYSYGVLFEDNTFTLADGTTLLYDSGYALANSNQARFLRNIINVTLYASTRLVKASVDQLWEDNTFNITSGGGGQVMGIGSAKATIFRGNTVTSNGALIVMSDGTIGGSLLIDNNAINSGAYQSNAIYSNVTGQSITVTNNVFDNYGALASSMNGITQSGNTFT